MSGAAAPLRRPRRYQLRREAAEAIAGGHPWVFRGQMSSAADAFADGQWLRLYDGHNRVVGHGVFEREGAIAIRVVRRGEAPVDAAWVGETVDRALARREALRRETDAFRALHGESDGLPAITLDVFAGHGVLTTYSAGVAGLARLAAGAVRRRLGLASLRWRSAHRSVSGGGVARVLAGAPPAVAHVREGRLALAVELGGGQKTGAFLDLRGLRRALAARGDLAGAHVLDLFSYTGGLGLAAAAAGAAEVIHADSSAAALAFGAAHHALGPARHAWIEADLFRGLPAELRDRRFELVIADPPQMTSRKDQVPRALAAYRRMYGGLAGAVAPGGLLVACCCTSRISLAELRRAVEAGLGGGFAFVERVPPEPDHPVGFREADYLKILLYRRAR